MKKLSLDLDALDVVTFDTTAAPEEEQGTVFGHVSRPADGCIDSGICPPASETGWTHCGTCLITCGYTCDDYSCVGTCQASCNCTNQRTVCYDSCCSDPC